MRALELKALSVGSNLDGGYRVPPEVEAQIGQGLKAISPIRAIAGVRTISANVYKKPFMISGPAVGWVGETDARTQTATLLEDAAVNIDQWLAQEVEQVFAAQEGTAFVTGDGINKPKGFLGYSTVAQSSWSWGNIGYVASGAAGAFPASNPSDVLVDLIYAVNAGYRQNAVFVMNRKTQSTIRKFKDSTGNYLWQPPATAGGRASLMGFPLLDVEDMPDVAANSLSIAFRRLQPRLSDRRPRRRQRAARPLHRQALRAVLHHQACGRRHAGFRRHQADEVSGQLGDD